MAVPLLNLANMLVAADHDVDAIVVLDALVTLNDTVRFFLILFLIT